MATWLTLDGNSAFPFTVAATPIISLLKKPVEDARDAAQIASTAMGVLKALGILGVGGDFLGTLRGQIDDLINDLINSGISALIIKPDIYNKVSKETGVDGFLRVVKTALVDEGDIQRPKFGWGDSSGGVLFLVSGPSLEELEAIAESLQILFGPAWTDLLNFVKAKPIVTPHVNYEVSGTITGIPEGADARVTFADETQNHMITQAGYDPYRGQQITMFTGKNVGITKRVDSFDNDSKVFTLKPGYRYPLEVGDTYALSYVTQSAPPDWATLRMVDIVPPVSAVAEVLGAVRDSIPVTGPSPTLDRLIAVLDAKALQFTILANNLNDLITVLDQLTGIPTIAMLPIEPQNGGNQGFTQEAFAANNPPLVGKNDITMGVVLYGGSGVYEVLKKVFPI